jgi:hypothetical protein
MNDHDVWEGDFLKSGRSTLLEQQTMLKDARGVIEAEHRKIEREKPIGTSYMWTCVQRVRNPDGSYRSCFSKHPSVADLERHKRIIHGEP